MKQGYWRLVSGREDRPKKSDADALEKYETKAEKAAGEIFLAVQPDQRVHFRDYEDDPVKMWSLIEAAHVQKKPGARFNAYDDLFSIQKNDDETLVELAVRIEQAVGNIKNLRPKGFTIEKLDEELQCMALIRALPEEYSHFSTSLLLLDSLDKDKILQAFRSEELNRQRRIEIANRAKANHASGSKKGSCHYCKKDGHWRYDCPELKNKRRNPGPKTGSGSGDSQAKKAEEKAEVVTESAGNARALYFNANSTSSNVSNWNTDTGATSHMTPHRHWIRNYIPYRVPIRLADNTVIYSEGVGTIVFRPVINGQQSRDVELTRILHVPALENNLLAVLYLTRQKGFEVHINFDTIAFSRNGTVLFTATIDDHNVGYLNGTTLNSSEQVHMSSTLPLDLVLWHKRLCHHNYGDIKTLWKDNLVEGMVIDSAAKPDPICEPCLAGKMHANPFLSSDTRATELLGLVHSDLHHVGTPSNGGFMYWITFIDDYSRFKVVIPLKKKSDSFGAFKTFKAYAENVTGVTLKAFRCDKGGEYISKEFIDYLDKSGVVRQYTVRNRPQQNGVAERANRTLEERITAMLAESGLPKRFWGDCLASFVKVWNCCPTSAVPGTTPYHLWHKRKPNIGLFRIWGCVAYVHIQKDKRDKLGPHMEKCIFIGYPDGYKGWKFYNPHTKRVIISERADFDERYTFGRISESGDITEHTLHYYTPGPAVADDEDEHEPITPAAPPTIEEQPAQADEEPESNQEPEQPIVLKTRRRARRDPVIVSDDDDEPDPRPIAIRKPLRKAAGTGPSERWKVRETTPAILSSDEEEDDEDSEAANNIEEAEPTTWKETMAGSHAEQWRDAALDEMKGHQSNGTWDLVELPPEEEAIGSKWVFKIKRKGDGSIERFKARLVAKGFSQRPGFDYLETYASTLRSATIRLILALAAIEDLHLRSLDISQAFVQSEIDTVIYIKQADGFQVNGPNWVWRLNKSLYGLKQSPRLFGKKFAEVMHQMGCTQLHSDPCVYIWERDGIKIFVPVFVDDITLASRSQEAQDAFVAELATHFKLRDLGPTSLLLGIDITRDRPNRKLYLSQRQYIINKLAEFGMTECKPVGTPMTPGLQLSKEDCPKTDEEVEEMQSIPYMNAVGSLLYLANTSRPDIAYTAGVLARFNSNPGMAHWKAVKHVFRYLKGTLNMKLEYGPDEDTTEQFVTFCDADHGGNKDNGKSTSGILAKVGRGAVIWISKLQSIVTLSTTEAEHVAGVVGGKEICWLRNMLVELGYKIEGPSQLWMDNQSSMSVAKNPEHHGRMKHLDLRFYWLRDEVGRGTIEPMYMQTDDMPADLLTKSLPKPKVEKPRDIMGLVL